MTAAAAPGLNGVVLTRRRALLGIGVAAAAGAGPAFLPRPSAARRAPTLRVAQWTHPVPAFDEWLDTRFARQWGERNGVAVEVEHFSPHDLRARAAAQVGAQQGHDLFGFFDSPAGYEDHAVPVDDVVTECERRFGRLVPLAHRATYNPKTKRYFAFPDAWAPAPLHYRADWWAAAGVRPDTWEHVREGARKIRERHGSTAGFGLSPEPDSNLVLRGLLWAFGAAEQDEAGRVTVNSRATVEALKLMTAVYRESMTSDVFMWDPSSNNRVFVWGRASIIENAISAMRMAERHNPDLARRSALAPPAAGPAARLSAAQLVHCYVIWRFSPNAELAKRFLVDLVAAYDEAFRASELYNFPAFPRAVRDLPGTLARDTAGGGRYAVLADAATWSACPGYPGHATAAIEEVVQRSVVPTMFARAARGELRPEEAARQAEVEMRRIFSRWTR